MCTYKHTDNNNHIITSTQSDPVILTHGNNRHFVEIDVPTLQSGGWDLSNTKIVLYRSPKTTSAAVLEASSFMKLLKRII